MSDKIENYLTLTQKYSILLLHANHDEPITGKVWFQKELFLISENIQKLADETDFQEDLKIISNFLKNIRLFNGEV